MPSPSSSSAAVDPNMVVLVALLVTAYHLAVTWTRPLPCQQAATDTRRRLELLDTPESQHARKHARLAALRRAKQAAALQPTTAAARDNRKRSPRLERKRPRAARLEQNRPRKASTYSNHERRESNSDTQGRLVHRQRGQTQSSATSRRRLRQGNPNSSFSTTTTAPMIYVSRQGVVTELLPILTLPQAETARFWLGKLGREFAPIWQRRGYRVLKISEMCCCSDGIPFARRRRHRSSTTIDGEDDDNCLGYNRTTTLGNGVQSHDIHIRLRRAENHHQFQSYDTMVRIMAHELAHCVHQNHSSDFWDLMADIEREFNLLMASGQVYQNASVQEQFGFNIYGTSTLSLHSS